MKKLLSILLAAVMLLPAMAACEKTPADPAETDPAITTAPAETGITEDPLARQSAKDNLPADFSLGGATVGVAAYPPTRPFDWDGGGEESADAVANAVYFRNQAVQERLSVTFETYVLPNVWNEAGDYMKTEVLSGSDDISIAFMRCGLTSYMGYDYLYQDLSKNKYLDFDNPWWAKDAIFELSIDGKNMRYLFGDVVPMSYLTSSVTFFNKVLYEDNFGSADDLYKMALERKWFYDKMMELIETGHNDVNGDGTITVASGDIYGMVIDNSFINARMDYGVDYERYHRGEDGIYTIEFDLNRAAEVLDVLYKLFFETKGAMYEPALYKTVPTTHTFTNGHSLFYVNGLENVRNSNFRDMQQDYGILPLPLLDEKQTEYRSVYSHDAGCVCIPVTCAEPDKMGAVLEALAVESYRSVTELVLESAMKVKYSRDQYSSQVIDIILETSDIDFLQTYASTIGSGYIVRMLLHDQSKSLSSSYNAQVAATNQKLKDLVAQYEQMTAEMNK